MPWVMMPVPAEHEHEFNNELMAIVMSSGTEAWDDDAVGGLLEVLTPQQHDFMLLIAGDVVDGDLASVRGLAEALDVGEQEILALREAINSVCDDRSRPRLVLYDEAAQADSAVGGSREVMAIARPVARRVMSLAADRAP